MNPIDGLGNEIKEGMMVLVKTEKGDSFLARVGRISPGGVIGRAEDQMPVPGEVSFAIIITVPYAQRVPLTGVWVLQQPSNQERAMASETKQ